MRVQGWRLLSVLDRREQYTLPMRHSLARYHDSKDVWPIVRLLADNVLSLQRSRQLSLNCTVLVTYDRQPYVIRQDAQLSQRPRCRVRYSFLPKLKD